jgi:hypothetical protein
MLEKIAKYLTFLREENQNEGVLSREEYLLLMLVPLAERDEVEEAFSEAASVAFTLIGIEKIISKERSEAPYGRTREQLLGVFGSDHEATLPVHKAREVMHLLGKAVLRKWAREGRAFEVKDVIDGNGLLRMDKSGKVFRILQDEQSQSVVHQSK